MPRQAPVALKHGRILIGLPTLVAVALIEAACWYYVRERESIQDAIVQELSAIAEIKCKQIEHWRAERLGDGQVLAASAGAWAGRRILNGEATSGADRANMAAVFEAAKLAFYYVRVNLVDSAGRVRGGDPLLSEELPGVLEAVRSVVRSQRVQLTELYREGASGSASGSATGGTTEGSIGMLLAVPVGSAGAIVLAIDPSRFLYPYVQAWPTASRTGETFLVRRDGDAIESISPLRYDAKSALRRRSRVAGSSIPDARILDAGWVRETQDYRGVRCITIVRHVLDSNWYLNAKIDVDEVYAPLSRLSWELAAIAALIALANGAGVGWIWRNQQLQAYVERKALSGHFDSLTRYANDIILLVDENYRIVEANQRAEQVYGYSEEELLGLPIEALLVEARRESIDQPGGTRFETIHRRRDGTEFPVEVSARAIDVEGFVFRQCIIRDITEAVRTAKEIHALNARLINAQEEERTRIARELHDDLSQQIAALSIGMSNLKRKLPPEPAEAREQSDRIQRGLVQVSESIRRLSHELHPAALEHAGLGAALCSYCSEFSLLTNIRVTCRTEGQFDRVPSAVALCVYRIAQEALQNVAKHAHVLEAEVALTRAAGTLSLTVSDRGAGMRRGIGGQPMGLGLISIKERTRLVNGALKIESEPDGGTTLGVRIPV
jgi:PAS domain S-box-containing protein